MSVYIWCTFVRWSLTLGASGFIGPVTFEIYRPPWASSFRSLLWRPSIEKVMGQASIHIYIMHILGSRKCVLFQFDILYNTNFSRGGNFRYIYREFGFCAKFSSRENIIHCEWNFAKFSSREIFLSANFFSIIAV